MDGPVIAVDRFTKYYGKTRGAEDVTFQVRPGEVFGFLGPNGAGKTTTIRGLLGLLRPTAGSIRIFNRAVSAASTDVRRRCGYLPGDFAGYAHLSAAEFIRFAARMRGADPTLPPSLLERLDLDAHTLSRRIKHLSHGTRQKIGIVQALFHRPDLLILDEPTTGLDPLMQETFYGLLAEARERGATVFFSSHILSEVEKTCDRVCIIREGHVVALEALEALRRRRFRRLTVRLREPVDALTLPGARRTGGVGLEHHFVVEGDVEPLLAHLARLPVADVALPEPGLEEVFMAYYRSDATE